MFWKYNYAVSPQIEQLLEKEDITLVELMEEEDILQECKAQNKKLVEFLLRSTTLEQLVKLIITEPSGDIEETSRYRLSNIACEILTCDLPALNERLSADKTILETLYAFIKQEPPLNPLLCSFFSKTLAMLITRHSEQNWYSYQFSCLQVVEFLKSQTDCITTLLRHIATPAIMDLLFKLISQVEGNEMRKSVIEWLNSQNIVPCLVNLLKPEYGCDIHCNVSQLLCDIVRADKELRLENADIDCVLTVLETPETVSLVLKNILAQPRMESSIVGGIQFLLVLLDQSVRSNFHYNNDFKKDKFSDNTQEELITALLPFMQDFHDILLNPPYKNPIKTTVGLLEVPLGNARLQITRFISTLVAETPPLTIFCNKIAELGITESLLDLFFKYSWNNFLHGYIEKIVASILQSNDNEITNLQKVLFDQGRLIQRMLEGWNNNINEQTEAKGVRKAYMGHIIKILNHIESVKSDELNDIIKSVLSKDSELDDAWSKFSSVTLKNVNETQSTLLGGVHPAHCKNDDLSSELKEEMPSICFGNFDEDNLDNALENKLEVFMNGLSMNSLCNDSDPNDDWQLSADSSDFALSSNDDPWGDVNKYTTPIGSDFNSTQEQAGWADFSCDNFADFDSNICQFNDATTFINNEVDKKNDETVCDNNAASVNNSGLEEENSESSILKTDIETVNENCLAISLSELQESTCNEDNDKVQTNIAETKEVTITADVELKVENKENLNGKEVVMEISESVLAINKEPNELVNTKLVQSAVECESPENKICLETEEKPVNTCAQSCEIPEVK